MRLDDTGYMRDDPLHETNGSGRAAGHRPSVRADPNGSGDLVLRVSSGTGYARALVPACSGVVTVQRVLVPVGALR
jgi:hypothetical protein